MYLLKNVHISGKKIHEMLEWLGHLQRRPTNFFPHPSADTDAGGRHPTVDTYVSQQLESAGRNLFKQVHNSYKQDRISYKHAGIHINITDFI